MEPLKTSEISSPDKYSRVLPFDNDYYEEGNNLSPTSSVGDISGYLVTEKLNKFQDFDWKLYYGVKPNNQIHHVYSDIERLKNRLGNSFRRFNKSIWNHLEMNLQVFNFF